jgi:hypothetical protein
MSPSFIPQWPGQSNFSRCPVDLAEAKTATLMQVSEGVVENYEEQDDE